MTTYTKRISQFALCAIVCTALLLAGCGRKESNVKDTSAPQLRTINFVTSKNAWCTLGLVAKNKRFFEEEGISAEIIIQDAGRYCMDALISKSAHFGTVVEVNVAYLGFTENRDVSIVASVVESASFAVVGRKNRGITAAKDLKGKTLAYSPGTGGELFAYKFLEHNNVSRGDVQFRKIQPLGIQGALISGEVDAAATWEPFIYNCLKALGNDGIALRDPAAYRGYLMLGVQREWAKQNPEIVSAFLRALKKAEDFVARNPTDAQAIIAKEINLDVPTVQSLWQYFTFEVGMDKPKLVKDTTSVGKSIIETQEAFAGKPVPAYGEYFDSTFLAQLKQMGTKR